MTSESLFVASGSQASVQATGLAGSYHWQARTVDSVGAPSAWVPRGGSPDFTANAGAGVPTLDTRDNPNGDCSGSAAGAGLPVLLAGFAALSLIAALLIPREKKGRA